MPRKKRWCAWCGNDLRRDAISAYCSPECAKEDGAPEAAPTAPKDRGPSLWTPQLDAQLREIAAAGATTQGAAEELTKSLPEGESFSKNAVIGRAQRIGVAWANSNGRVEKPVPKPPSADFPAHGMCVFPIGHPPDEAFHFCAEKVAKVGVPYCAAHMKLCWSKQAPAPRNLTDEQRAAQARRAREGLAKRDKASAGRPR